MKLTERKLGELSDLKYKTFICSFPKRTHLKAVVVAFKGEYGYGSKGNGDAYFMTAIIKAALAAWTPSALVIDLRKMSYEWGDLIAMAFAAGEGQYIDASFPTAVIISERNREGLTSLIREEMFCEPSDWLFDTIEEAMGAVEKQRK